MEKKYKPFILTTIIIVLDQIVKALVVKFIPENTVFGEYLFGYLRICHVRNNAVAFSFGTEFPLFIKYIMFVALPIFVMFAICYALVSPKYKDEFTCYQKWLLAGIVGGGFGNIIDRLFRSLRVVDFVSTRMYGAFNMEWFPTYNIADSSVVICGILLLLSFIVGKKGKKNE